MPTPLPDPWPDMIIRILGATIGGCASCFTPETDGDLCAQCHEAFDRVADIVRPLVVRENT